MIVVHSDGATGVGGHLADCKIGVQEEDALKKPRAAVQHLTAAHRDARWPVSIFSNVVLLNVRKIILFLWVGEREQVVLYHLRSFRTQIHL